MVNKPFFSIIIPTYNRAQDLEFALYCILRQNFLNFEVIVSDNCSTDNTKGIVESYKDKRIRYLKNKKNIGVILNLRKAITYACGDYVFLHSDDDFLLYETSLREISMTIKKHNLGYIRVNYICLTPDKKRIFDFRVNKSFVNNRYLLQHSENDKVLSFILGSDPAFVTGIIYKNTLPDNITVINSELLAWIKILFFTSKNWGAYFIAKQHIIASWSTWRTNPGQSNPLYSLIQGKLSSENYLNFIKEQLNKESYREFLKTQLMRIYVRMLPAIKLYTGRKNMLQLSVRLRYLDRELENNIFFWVYLVLALILPRFLLKFIKDLFFFKYSRFSKSRNNEQISKKIGMLEEKFLHN
ncbi:MAG: glycosyltransferase family 2 protein [bacterium]